MEVIQRDEFLSVTHNGTVLHASLSYLKEADLYDAKRVFDINYFLYSNGYRFLTSYLSEYFKNNNGNYVLDGMTITKYSDDIIEIDLSNAKDYIIEEPNDDDREYGMVKIISPSGNTYLIANSPSTGDYKYGYFQPTEKGLAYKMECGGKLRTFILNSNGRNSVTNGECFDLKDIFYNIYLNQSSTNWNFRDIVNISKADDKNYTIKLKNLNDSPHISIRDIFLTDGRYNGARFAKFSMNESDPSYRIILESYGYKNERHL